MKRIFLLLLLGGVFVPFTFATCAVCTVTCSFERITHNIDACDISIGEGQLFVDFFESGQIQNPDDPSQWLDVVGVKFRNEGPIASVISEIYLDGDTFTLCDAIDDSLKGVDFKEDYSGKNAVKPTNLPGGNTIGFEANTAFSVEAETPEPHNGISPGEWLQMDYVLAGGNTFQDMLDQLASGQLRFGIHVKAIGCDLTNWCDSTVTDDFSESFVNSSVFINCPDVPEPATLALLGIGCLLLRKRSV